MKFFVMVLIGALVLRLTGWYVFNFILFEGEFFHADSAYYHALAIEQAQFWENGEFKTRRLLSYINVIAPFYAAFGAHRAIPELIGVLAGAFLVVPMYLIGQQMGRIGVAKWASVLVAIDPLMIYYSTQLLRDSLITLAFAFILLGIVASLKKYNVLALAGAALIGLVLNRFYVTLSVGVALLGVSGLYWISIKKLPLRWGILGTGFLGITYLGHVLVGGQAFTADEISILDAVNRYPEGCR